MHARPGNDEGGETDLGVSQQLFFIVTTRVHSDKMRGRNWQKFAQFWANVNTLLLFFLQIKRPVGARMVGGQTLKDAPEELLCISHSGC